MLKERLAGEVRVGGVFDPTRDHRLVRQPKRVLQIEQPGDDPGRRGRAAGARGEEPGLLLIEHLPVDQRGTFHQFVARVDHVDQARAQQVVLFRRAGAMLHAADRICRVSTGIIGNPTGNGEKNRLFWTENQRLRRCSGRTK